MENDIGEIAGHVWDFLEDAGEASPSKIARKIEASQNKVYMALGWLARENKLSFDEKGRGKAVRLNY